MSLKRSRASDDLCKMFPFCHNKFSIIIIIAFLFSSSTGGDIARAAPNGECLSPGGGRGTCKNINECKPLKGLLIKGKSRPSPWVIDFLKRSHCGFEGKDPVVCCPLSGKPNEPYGNANSTESETPSRKFLSGTCGSVQTLDKIIGGSTTARHEFPWMALIGYRTRHGIQFRCGGSLVSSRYVLTAAHCVANLKDISPTVVRLGEHDLGKRTECGSRGDCDPPARDVDIEDLVPHPEYFKPELRNDIALIRLTKNVEFKAHIRPICLPVAKDVRERSLTNEKGVVAGWGTTESGTNSQVLRKITIPIVPLSECSKVYKKRVPITESQICAGGEAGKDSCSGDSGGPLHVLGLNPSGEPAYFQEGIVSFGPRNCGTRGIPGVYTRVDRYVDWVLANMKE